VPLHWLYQYHRCGAARGRVAWPRLTDITHVDTHIRRSR
jgi:hypothetical protein